MSGVDRRAFLRDVVAASAVAAGSTLVPQSADALPPDTSALTWTATPCRLCGVGCGLLVGVQGGRAVTIKGDPSSPVGKGLACAKGYYAVQGLHGRDRITRAMIRRDGVLTAVPLTAALDLVATRLRDSIRQHGKDSVAFYGSAQGSITDAYIASKFFKGAIGTNNVETSARLHSAAVAAGLRTTFGLEGSPGSYDDIDHADVFVLWDINLAETDPVLFSRILDRKRLDPAIRIIDVATRTTRTSYAADRAMLYAPRTTLAIANAIAQEIAKRKLFHRDFLERHVAFRAGASGSGRQSDAASIDDTPRAATWSDYAGFLEANGPELAQRVSGLDVDSIRWLASVYGDPSRKVMSIWGANVSQHSRGTWTNNALYNIHLLTGKIASPGNAALALTGQPTGGCAVHDAGARADALPGGWSLGEADRKRAASLWSVSASVIDSKTGLRAISMFRALDDGDLRFLWIQGTNPMVSLPDASRYRRAAAKADRFVVVSEAYRTPTTEVADVVLPSAMWLERDAIYGNVERRLQWSPRVVAPPGDAMTDGAQLIEIANRLGFSRMFPSDPRGQTEAIWAEYRRFNGAHAALPALADLRRRPGVVWPLVAGKETKWRYNTSEDSSADVRRGSFDFYGHPDGKAWIWIRPFEAAAESPTRAYPLWLTAGPVLEHWGGGAITQRIPTLHRAVPSAYVEMHREDAARLGVINGERVRIVSARGAVEAEAKIGYRSQPSRGQVFVPSFDEAVLVRSLMSDAIDPSSGQPDLGPCAVRIERMAAGGVP
jgi:nitrate reductase (cytochrome)